MIPSVTNSPPETQTTGRMILSVTNSPPEAVSTQWSW